ncbi:M1 family metallopeptidase [Sulfurisphaera tokodaii]|uniref:Probable aminopeptidase 1 n=2 Tax=Sulfurisphaera tokodaii TaxID=111955 RepID=APE1_SULTO|nr:M1 family metallopeptidase [Sulfurisphaera tokodaii]Q96ZT9.1 RecName: Full=Probable aminopeptidase 1 [Sulfurisphaera tokodaii str. 7]BAB66834.1 probable leucyl aminopeptidase [Sulfurisphaera tokodaii str. 7]HII73365.1 M1 family metallopeptidase [Sulfurisphaera tokodaii]
MVNVERYEIFLDFNEYSYEGMEKIKMKSDGEKVELDSVGLEIKEVKADGKQVKYETKNEKLIVYSKVNEELEIRFSGKADNKSILGIYVAPYDGNYLITTQFEPIYARKFIPCFDSPDMKAVFKLSVRVNRGQKVISNMPIISIRDDGEKIVYEFDETPRMSTYLLYLGIGDFEEISDESKKPKIILATTPGKSKRGIFAIEVARKVIDYYEKYFEIPYQLPKLHLIEIPEFAAGAMENWGAITFRESALLADESSSVSQKLSVSAVIAHELAHQWFGDMVTLKWWDDLWLNESFATFMAYKSLKEIFPQWESEGHFIYDETLSALTEDSLLNTHPIETHVKDPHEIEEMFDNISYGKGASILRMIEAYVGEEVFRRGVVNYLNKFKFSNASGSDLWNSISEAYGSDISQIMAEWITKPGYPVITVNVEGDSVEFFQRRFTLLNVNDSTIYKVPLTFEVNGKRQTLLLDKESVKLNFDNAVSSIKVNLNRTGFYRVLYKPFELSFSSTLNSYEELGLVNDYWNFLLAGLESIKTYLTLIKRFSNTRNSFLSREIAFELMTLYYINKDKYYSIARDFLLNQIKIYRNAKDDLGKMAYSSIIRSLAIVDDDFALGLSNLFQYYEQLDSNIKGAVAIAYAISTSDFNGLLDKYKSFNSDEEKLRMIDAITNIRDKSIVEKLAMLVFNRTIKYQEAPHVINSLSNNPYVREELCNFLQGNFDMIKQFVVTVAGMWGLFYIIRGPMIMCGVNKPEETIEFLDRIKTKEIARSVEITKEYIKVYNRVKNLDL